jgi:hypothetical protein
MCNIFVKSPDKQFWKVNCDDFGMLQDSSIVVAPSSYNAPVLRVTPLISWRLAADVTGELTTELISPTPISALPYVILNSPSGFTYLLTATLTGLLSTTFSAIAIQEAIPTQIDISMSQFPMVANVTCPACGNANVTVTGDYSCWCCACNSFVRPEDTTILIQLEE